VSAGRLHKVLLAVLACVFVWSAINPHDYFTWFLEVVPAVAGTAILLATYRKFPFTPVAYILMAFFMCILMVGGHYTYALVPVGRWVSDALHLSRNHFDRLGHFFQGVIPAMVGRELLLRKGVVKKGGWLFFICTCIALAISACYEFVEWWTSLATGTAGDAFLGTQGDPWDTQSDMFMAFTGAMISQLVLFRLHDRQLEEFMDTDGPRIYPFKGRA
jgi:putative membrane protein